MLKYLVIGLAMIGSAYLLMVYANPLWQKVAFTTNLTGAVSYATCVLIAVACFLFTKLATK